MKAYRIVNWDKLYENNRTRDMRTMSWIPVPVKHDGYGYCQLVKEKGAARLGAWLAILQTAAKSHPRGTLLRDGKHPHTAESIALKTRLTEDIITETLKVCLSPKVDWLEVVEVQGNTIKPAENPHPPAENPQETVPLGKGTLGNSKEQNKNNNSIKDTFKGDGKGTGDVTPECDTSRDNEFDKYSPVAEALKAILQSQKNVKVNKSKLKAWVNSIRLLEQQDGVTTDRMLKALEWYKDHAGEQYIPVIESGRSLREKFLKLESAIERENNGHKDKRYAEQNKGEFPEDIKPKII